MPLDIKIEFEDENIILINKPAGLVTTFEGGKQKGLSLDMWLTQNYKWANKLIRGGLVHRLDKDTSGLILVAKNNKWLDILKKQFGKRLVDKQYLALVEGETGFEGQIYAPIKRGYCQNHHRRQVGVAGKTAWTVYKLIKTYTYQGKKYSFIRVFLKTGRTHQIRVHFSYLGWPLVGDKLYGSASKYLNRPFLQSSKIGFKYGSKWFELEVGLARDLQNLLDSFDKQNE